MDVRLLRYYKKKMHGGRSIAARAVDFVMLRAALFVFLFVTILYLSLSTLVALLVSIFMTIAVSLALLAVNRRKAQTFITGYIKKLKQKCLLEKLTFMRPAEYADYINALLDGGVSGIVFKSDGFCGTLEGADIYVLQNHPGEECGVSDVLRIIRLYPVDKRLLLFSLSEFTEGAKKMCASLGGNVELAGGKAILAAAGKKGMLPDEAEAEAKAEKELNETVVTLKQLKSNAFSKTKIKGYIICGLVVMCWPFVKGFRIYYPVIALVCFALAFIAYRKSRHGEKESSDTGLKLT